MEERSFSSLLPSKVHRRSSLENRPHPHEDSEDEAVEDNSTLVSGSHHGTKVRGLFEQFCVATSVDPSKIGQEAPLVDVRCVFPHCLASFEFDCV